MLPQVLPKCFPRYFLAPEIILPTVSEEKWRTATVRLLSDYIGNLRANSPYSPMRTQQVLQRFRPRPVQRSLSTCSSPRIDIGPMRNEPLRKLNSVVIRCPVQICPALVIYIIYRGFPSQQFPKFCQCRPLAFLNQYIRFTLIQIARRFFAFGLLPQPNSSARLVAKQSISQPRIEPKLVQPLLNLPPLRASQPQRIFSQLQPLIGRWL